MANVFGLYYPHVHFRDEGWLKLSALYLDRLYHLYDNFAEITLPSITQTEMSLAVDDFTKAIRPARRSRTEPQSGSLMPSPVLTWPNIACHSILLSPPMTLRPRSRPGKCPTRSLTC